MGLSYSGEGGCGCMTTLSEPLQGLSALECLWIFQFAPFVNFRTIWPLFHCWHHAQNIFGEFDFFEWKFPEFAILFCNSFRYLWNYSNFKKSIYCTIQDFFKPISSRNWKKITSHILSVGHVLYTILAIIINPKSFAPDKIWEPSCNGYKPKIIRNIPTQKTH